MKKHLSLYPLLFAMALGTFARAQDDPPVTIGVDRTGDTYTFSIDPDDLPTLQDDASGNEPYYSYYWEFGDFRFAHSTTPEVEHVYHQRFVGEEVTVRLYLKAHYALSPRIVREPLTRSHTVRSGASRTPYRDVPNGSVWLSSSDYAPAMETEGGGEDGRTTHQIQEREDFVLILSVRPVGGRDLQGANLKLNTRRYANFFAFKGMHYEAGLVGPVETVQPGRRLPSELNFRLNDFADVAGTNIFIYLTPDRSGKKSALGKEIDIDLSLDKDGEALGEYTLVLEVVESRDPNRMLVADRYVEDWKGFFENGLSYRVDFQNYGSGPVENGIEIEIDLPAGTDPRSFRLFGHHSAACSTIQPELSPCDTIIDRSQKDKVIVNLDDAGLTSKNDDERRSKGFIAYNIKPQKNIGKCRWKSQARVQFTSARRVARTNKVSTDFKGSFSLGLKTMVTYFPGDQDSYYSAGLVLGSDKHCRYDPRFSVMFGVERLNNLFQPHDNYYLDIALTPFRIEPIIVDNGKWTFLGTGVGVQCSLAFLERSEKRPLVGWTGFGDVTLVSKRKGPRLGVQYHANINFPDFDVSEGVSGGGLDLDSNRWQFYITWSF